MEAYLENMRKSQLWAEKLEREAMFANISRWILDGRLSIKEGDTSTIENVTIAQRKRWQFCKRKNSDAKKPATFTVVRKV